MYQNYQEKSLKDFIFRLFILYLSMCAVYSDLAAKCGNIPETCKVVITWVLQQNARTTSPDLFTGFKEITGVELTNANQSDLIMFWLCTDMNGWTGIDPNDASHTSAQQKCLPKSNPLTRACDDERKCPTVPPPGPAPPAPPSPPLGPIDIKSQTVQYIGFAASTFLMKETDDADIVTDTKITEIASNLKSVQNYRFYGGSQDKDLAIAQAIVEGNGAAQFMLEIDPQKAENLDDSVIKTILDPWEPFKDYIKWIALGNEPLNNKMTFSKLPEKLELLAKYLKNNDWKHVKATIPFTSGIMYQPKQYAGGWKEEDTVINNGMNPKLSANAQKPDPNSAWNYKPHIKKILNTMNEYNGVFSFQPYTFPVKECHTFLSEWCMGNAEPDSKTSHAYDSMIESAYASMRYALDECLPNNVDLMITETGWSTQGPGAPDEPYDKDFYTVASANAFYHNTLKAMQNSKSPLYRKYVFFFELFDEKGKGPPEAEKNFGLFQQNGVQKMNLTVTKDLIKGEAHPPGPAIPIPNGPPGPSPSNSNNEPKELLGLEIAVIPILVILIAVCLYMECVIEPRYWRERAAQTRRGRRH